MGILLTTLLSSVFYHPSPLFLYIFQWLYLSMDTGLLRQLVSDFEQGFAA